MGRRVSLGLLLGLWACGRPIAPGEANVEVEPHWAPGVLPDGHVGRPYQAQLQLLGAEAPVTFRSTLEWPEGLTFGRIEGQGVELRGVPTAAYRGELGLEAMVDGRPIPGRWPLVIHDVGPTLGLEFLTRILAPAYAGRPYQQALLGRGGQGDLHFQVVEGALPPGLDLALDGERATINGTPTELGRGTFVVALSDGVGQVVQRRFDLEVKEPRPLSIRTSALPPATIDEPYEVVIEAEGGSGLAYRWTTPSALPPGLSLLPNGTPGTTLSGRPSRLGTSTVAVSVEDSAGQRASARWVLTVVSADLPRIEPTELPSGEVGRSFHAALTALGGAGGYRFRLVAGALPAGLTSQVTATRFLITGTPSEAGAVTLALEVTDAENQVAVQDYRLSIDAAPEPLVALGGALPEVRVAEPASVLLPSRGGRAPLVARVVARSLPSGLSLNSVGAEVRLEGTPLDPGPASFALEFTDLDGHTDAALYHLEVLPAPGPLLLPPVSLPSAAACTPTHRVLTAQGGTERGYRFALEAGALPPGWTLRSGTPRAELLGAATQAGVYTFTLAVEDDLGHHATQDFEQTITAAPLPTWLAWVRVDGLHLGAACGSLLESTAWLGPGPFGPILGTAGGAAVTGLASIGLDQRGVVLFGDLDHLSIVDPGPAAEVVLSPDGATMALRLDRDADGRDELWWGRPDLADFERIELAPPQAAVVGGTIQFSPDGDRLIYTVDPGGGAPLQAGWAKRKSPGVIEVGPLDPGAAGEGAVFRPDGSGVALIRRSGAEDQLTWVSFTGDLPESPVALGPRGRLRPGSLRFSPDGRDLAWLVEPVGGAGQELWAWTVSADGAGPPRRIHPMLPAGAEVSGFLWSNDGASLLYRADARIPSVPELFEVHLDDGRVRPVHGPLPNHARVAPAAGLGFGYGTDGAIVYLADVLHDEVQELWIREPESAGAYRLSPPPADPSAAIQGFSFGPAGVLVARSQTSAWARSGRGLFLPIVQPAAPGRSLGSLRGDLVVHPRGGAAYLRGDLAIDDEFELSAGEIGHEQVGPATALTAAPVERFSVGP